MARFGYATLAPHVPSWYFIFMLYVEPLACLVASTVALLYPATYLSLTSPSLHENPAVNSHVDLGTTIVLGMLANMYILCGLCEVLVLPRCLGRLDVWKRFLLVFLVADLGHILVLAPLDPHRLYRVRLWGWGDVMNYGFVYLGAATRTAFLLEIGFDPSVNRPSKPIRG